MGSFRVHIAHLRVFFFPSIRSRVSKSQHAVLSSYTAQVPPVGRKKEAATPQPEADKDAETASRWNNARLLFHPPVVVG